jgi:hypothetical protein
MTDPTSRQRGRPKNDKTETFNKKNLWSKVPYLGSTPRHTDWLTVSRKVTLTLTNVIILSKPGYSYRSFSFRFSPRSVLLSHARYLTRPTRNALFDYFSNIGEKYKAWRSPLSCYFNLHSSKFHTMNNHRQAKELGFPQPLTDMSTRNRKIIMFLGNKVRRVLKADNLTATRVPIV